MLPSFTYPSAIPAVDLNLFHRPLRHTRLFKHLLLRIRTPPAHSSLPPHLPPPLLIFVAILPLARLSPGSLGRRVTVCVWRVARLRGDLEYLVVVAALVSALYNNVISIAKILMTRQVQKRS